MSLPKWQLIHATALCLGGIGFLLLGKSRSGKSDLALRLILEEDARLVGDDICEIAACYGSLFVKGVSPLVGVMEIRPWGPRSLRPEQTVPRARLGFACSLDEGAQGRLLSYHEGINVPVYPVNPFEESAISKIKLLVQEVQDGLSPQTFCLQTPKRAKQPL